MEFKAVEVFSKIMHRVTSRVLIGEELCRNDDYIRSSMALSESIFINALTLSNVPLGPFRRVGSWAGSYSHRRKLERAVKLVLPVVERRRMERAKGPTTSRHSDAIEWTIELSESIPDEDTTRRIVLQILHNLWAGSAAPAGLLTQMLFQVLMEPDYLEPLRAECGNAITSCGWSEEALSHMPLLDSFIREMNRLYPTGSGQY